MRPRTIQRFNDLKERIKKRHPSQYSGQGTSPNWPLDYRNDAKELEKAGQYDHSLTLVMLDAFMSAGGRDNETYRFPLHGIKKELNEKFS